MLQSYVTPARSATEAAQIAPLTGLAGLPGALIAMVISRCPTKTAGAGLSSGL
jgi:hypothetical protein